jgi:soluble cytochrome b562
MNSRSFIPVLVAFLYFAAFAFANAKTPLELAMTQMHDAYKELSSDLQQPSDANKGDYLGLAGVLNTQAQKARGFVPQKVATLPVDQQDAMVKAYQKSMDDLIQSINSLTQDIQNSDWDDARKAMAAMKQQMIHGHKDFRLNSNA